MAQSTVVNMDTYLRLGPNTKDLTSKPVFPVVRVHYQNRAQSKLQFFVFLSFREFEFQVQFVIKLLFIETSQEEGASSGCIFSLTVPAACLD